MKNLIEAIVSVLSGESEMTEAAQQNPALSKLIDKYDVGFLDEADYDEDDRDIKKQVKSFQSKFKITHRHIAFATQEFIEENGDSWNTFVSAVKRLTKIFVIDNDLTGQNSSSKIIYFTL
jgi:hypothetical protein